MKKKRYYTGGVSALLCVSMLLAACSGGGGSGDSSNPKDSANVSAPGALPISKEKVTITVTVPSSPTVLSWDYGKNELTTWLEDQTNVHINWNFYPAADAKTKLNLELSSGGDLGDLIMGNFGLDNSALATYGTQGVIRKVEDLVEKHGVNVKKMYQEYPNIKMATTAPDGHVYGFPQVGICYNCDRAMRFWVNKSFLKALNMKVPTTTDELYEYLKAVKEKDPNGNGKKDEIGIVGSPKSWFAKVDQFIMNAFTYQDSNGLYVKDDKVVAAFTTQDWRDGIRYLNKLYREGLIDQSSFTNDEAQLKQMVELNGGNTVGAVPNGGPHAFAAQDLTRLNYEIVPPLKGPKGFQTAYFNEFGIVGSYQFVIPAASKHPDAVMKLIDFMYSHEAFLRSRYGVPGVNWEIPKGTTAANGGPAQFKLIGKDLWQEPQNVHWQGANTAWPPFGSDSREMLPEGRFDLEKVLFDAAKLYDKYAAKVSVPKFFFEPNTATRFNDLKTEINKKLEAAIADFIVGNQDIEKDWDKFQAELKALGLDEYMSIMQKEYDAKWKGSKK
ncbi:extracellular solute-binding protein [Paenibacillus hamazuiensis]|uniref:extracellular solute-binding protein n=1 Tax=Paenibacillus hamazuiensis TaxID=2936508 RepID=UPI00200C9274|nr:extracellular solute-binding protein [Paenibacillus hamazuiensis]